MSVQAFAADLAIKRLNKGVVCRLARPREVENDVIGIGPEIEITRYELTVIKTNKV